MSEKKLTGFKDMHLRPIYEGDEFIIPEHNNQCCNHALRCRIVWDSDYNKYLLKHGDEIIASGDFAEGYPKIEAGTQ